MTSVGLKLNDLITPHHICPKSTLHIGAKISGTGLVVPFGSIAEVALNQLSLHIVNKDFTKKFFLFFINIFINAGKVRLGFVRLG